MSIIRWWGPAREMNNRHHHMNCACGESFRSPSGDVESKLQGAWVPNVDIFETEAEIVLKVEVPGVTKNQVEVEVDEGILHVKGERQIEKDVKEENYHRIERVYGSFNRSFVLPDSVDPEKVGAELKDGVLDIRLGKHEQSKPKNIRVNVN
jgi:HSP20 family protein